MSPPAETRPDRHLRAWMLAWLVLLVVCALNASCAWLNSMDTDTWWHLAGGRIFVTQLRLPLHDPLSYTSDVPWLCYEWLCDSGLYCLMVAHGFDGLLVLRSVVVVLVALGLFLVGYRNLGRGRTAVAVAALMAIYAAWLLYPYYLVRPHLVGYLSFVLWLWLFFGLAEGGMPMRRFVPGAAALVFVTVNYHPTFIFVPGFLLLWLISEGVARRMGWDAHPAVTRAAAVALGVTCLVSLLNPRGLRMALHPFDYVVPMVYTRDIAEYQGVPFLHQQFMDQALLGLSILAMGLAWRQRRLYLLVILALLVRQGESSHRYFAYQVLFTLPALALVIRPWVDRVQLSVRMLEWTSLGCLAVAAAVVSGTVRNHLPLSRDVQWDTFPIDAVRFINLSRLPSRIFNAFEWGGYLEWELPDHTVYIDARNDAAFSERVYFDYMKIARAMDGWQAGLDRYGVDVVLLRRNEPVLELNTALAQDPHWVCVYRDHIALVFVRRSALTPAQVSYLRTDYRFPHSPYLETWLGQQALQTGNWAEGEACFARAVAGDPFYAPAQVGLGVVFARSGRIEEARARWERAVELDPSIAQAHYNLGVYWEQAKDVKKALAEFRLELRNAPNSAAAQSAIRRLEHP